MELINGVFVAHDRMFKIVSTDKGMRLDIGSQSVVVDPYLGNDMTITLPQVAKSAGDFISISIMGSVTGDGEVLVKDRGDGDLSDITLDADFEFTMLYSDGVQWRELCSNHA